MTPRRGAYYNEIDPFAAAWLRELIAAGHIAAGDVDERSLADVSADDVRGFTQCHWFAGIGGWSYALRLAGWPDDRPVWTGSCPCQPFSSAGTQTGGNDPRDLWPVWFKLIAECRPGVVFGEQVEAAIGHGWLDRLCDDLEAEGYAVGACGLPAASVGAFHIRQRLWFVADADRAGSNRQWLAGLPIDGHASQRHDADGCGEPGNVGHAASVRFSRIGGRGAAQVPRTPESGNAHFWSDVIWLPCSDGKARPVKPGIFPLASGVPNRVGLLRGAGNAIVPQVAAAFINAYLTRDRLEA